jgi:hypothetical protein
MEVRSHTWCRRVREPVHPPGLVPERQRNACSNRSTPSIAAHSIRTLGDLACRGSPRRASSSEKLASHLVCTSDKLSGPSRRCGCGWAASLTPYRCVAVCNTGVARFRGRDEEG